MSDTLRIGELANAAGTTPRTIRYYEEIGLLGSGGERESGRHRCYDEADLERLREIMRLRDLLGVSLDELKELVEHEDARATLRAELERSVDTERRREILLALIAHLDRQLEMVRRRSAELRGLEDDLLARKRRARAGLRGL